MTDVEKDILARFTALEELVAFLLAKQLRALTPVDSAALKESTVDKPRELVVGLMDAEEMQDISVRIEASMGNIASQASALEVAWRNQAGE